MKSSEARYTAVAAAQLVMGRYTDIQADGKWGRFTQRAFEQMTPEVQLEIRDLVMRMSGMSVSDLYAYRSTQKAIAKSMPVDRQNIKDLVAQIAEEEGVPVMTAMKIAFLESRFNPDAKSPTGAIGVFQLTGIAVKDLKQRGNYIVADRYNAEQNIRGGIKYIKIAARDIGARLDEAWKVYMAFNIGPTGARAVLAGNANSVASLINKQAYGPPPVYQARLTQAVASALA